MKDLINRILLDKEDIISVYQNNHTIIKIPKTIINEFYFENISIIGKNNNTLLNNLKNIMEKNLKINKHNYKSLFVVDFNDNDEIYSYLERNYSKFNYIFVVDVFSDTNKSLVVNYFLKKYKHNIDYYFNTGLHSNLLIIKIKNEKNQKKSEKYSEINKLYDENYYLNDCGGYEYFNKYCGKVLDSRLLNIFLLTNPEKNDNILDIGCGRGELSFFININSNAKITGLDYSIDAIKIAKKNFKENEKLSYVCKDIFNYFPENKFNKIIAADIVEHIEEEMLLKMFEQISNNLLTAGGVFLIHTAPNKFFYDIIYKEKKLKANEIDVFIPKNPRSYYEEQMHINEQNHINLDFNLKKYFKYVETWCPTFENFWGRLDNKKTEFTDEIKTSSIFSIASNSKININTFKNYFSQNDLSGEVLEDIEIIVLEKNIISRSCEINEIKIKIKNNSYVSLKSSGPFPVHISYHVFDEKDNLITFDGIRSEIYIPSNPNSEKIYYLKVLAPKVVGKYKVFVSLVQEGKFWFEDKNKECFDILILEVK